MIVHVVTCADPIPHGEVWAHGVYTSRKSAKKVYDRLVAETCNTVQINTIIIHQPRRNANRRK